jgi:hypothetical protein
MGPGSTEEVVARCARVAEEADALAARVRGLPPPSWTGPAAEELVAGVRRAVRLLDDGADAVHRAGVVARHVGAG